MAIRINRRHTKQVEIVELHGWLGEDTLGEFESLCGSIRGPLLLDLSNLVGADEAGLLALRRRGAGGARIEGASPYIRMLLDSVPAVPDEPNKHRRP